MILVWDCETDGLANMRTGATDPAQPNLVQLCGMLMDGRTHCVAMVNEIVKPDGWVISDKVAKIHGITQEMALEHGKPLWSVLWQWERLVRNANIRVAHNLEFDDLVVETAYFRLGVPYPLKNHAGYCTMLESKDLVQIPGRHGDFKWPKLTESYKHFFGEDLEFSHDALVDVRACARVYWAIQDAKI